MSLPKPPEWLDVELLDRDHRQDWRHRARCIGLDLDIFYPARGEDTREAKAVCNRCPVKYACLAEALSDGGYGDDFGIRGGCSVRERRAIRKMRALAGAA